MVLSEKTMVIGLGNPDRADDGGGIEIVSQWKARLNKRAFLDTEGTVETAVLDGLENPSIDTFLFVDAADFGGRAGEIRLFSVEDAERFHPALSTHKVPLDMLMSMAVSRGKKAFLLGIQAGSVELFGGMTEGVQEAVRILKAIVEF